MKDDSTKPAGVMDEDDDEVVFTNTALYDHLVTSGFNDFESASCLEEAVDQTTKATAQSQQKVASVKERLVTLLDWLSVRPGPLLVPAALSALLTGGLMSDRDRAMAADLCSDQRQTSATPAISDSFLLAAFVAGVAIAVFLPASCLLLSVALVSYVGGAVVARVRAAAGRRCVDQFCRSAGELKRAGLRCCRLLQESHLMARGVTLSSGDPGAEAAFTAQYGELVQAAGACLHAACAAYGGATRRLRSLCPLLDGVDPAKHYVAFDGAALVAFTERQFTVKDVKTLQQLLADCQSEFVRRCCLGLCGDLLPPEASAAPPVPLPLLSELSGTLAELQRRLSAAYRAHAALWTAEPAPAPAAAPAAAAAGRQRLYVGVHSVCLQAQVVALRARALEEALSGAGEGDGAAPDPELHDRLRRELVEIQQRLQSGQLFCEQTVLQLSRLQGQGEAEQAPATAPPTTAAPATAPPALADLPEPELVDQFFEAVVEGGAPADDDSEDDLLSREERLRRRLERDRARELLKELSVALTGKREEWRVREAVAKGEPVPPPEQGGDPGPRRTGPERAGNDPYAVNKADLYDFSGSEDEEEQGKCKRWRLPAMDGGQDQQPDVTDGRRQLNRLSDSAGGSLVLPPAGDLTHLLPVQRRAPPPARRPPSRPSSTVGTPRPGATGAGTVPGQGGTARPGVGLSGVKPANTGPVLLPAADSDSSPSVAGSSASLTSGAGDSAHGAGPGGPSRYRAAALGLPSRQGFPAEMAAQAAALALRRRGRLPAEEEEEVFGEDGSDSSPGDA